MFQDSFVLVKLVIQESEPNKALENPGAAEMIAQWGGANAGLPFLVFLNARGEKIADSNRTAKGTNIGCPATPEEVEAFKQILKETAPRITAEQREKVGAHFLELNKKK
jgi:hypothetical protein